MSTQSSLKASATVPPFAAGIWNPFLIGATAYNENAYQALSPLISDWQDFVRRRLTGVESLMQNLAHSKSPNDVWNAYSDFWQKAVEDYGNELTKVTNKMVTAAQPRD